MWCVIKLELVHTYMYMYVKYENFYYLFIIHDANGTIGFNHFFFSLTVKPLYLYAIKKSSGRIQVQI